MNFDIIEGLDDRDAALMYDEGEPAEIADRWWCACRRYDGEFCLGGTGSGCYYYSGSEANSNCWTNCCSTQWVAGYHGYWRVATGDRFSMRTCIGGRLSISGS